ncbi:ABC transporter ATP-binding protein [Thermanaerothrix sp. 4228-RoL]|uniref:ABC transporter ATP-binding protein n=1 Tax=Thermanaerothrix solaris TaxID=3058434 RepID=A0ABU3NME0_9CHLR|nr:ABC transporter ATP-binding protein [Thermanaerothrix sp. 4228-RoL]MDT8898020.1 ABC transporter ATP-binding protein [Thermanaerothrix sp. 4228-RoL]
MTANSSSQPLLDVRDLKTYFFTEDGVVKAVDGISFQVFPGEVLGLVGESGCGKSVTSLSIMRLLDAPGKIVGGEIWFEGQNLLALSEHEMTQVRGNQISMVFQQPVTSLNPVFNIGSQIAEVIMIHNPQIKKTEAWREAVNLLRLVGVPDPERRAYAFPHELSGGQAQRVMIAMALALRPKLLIADEPTTALDVTIQAQILDLLRGLRSQFNTAVILITHDLGVVAEMADRVAVMYAGKIVEEADVRELFANPLHPYTRGLIASVPVLGRVRDYLETIPGNVPNLIDLPPGCRFAPRCQARLDYSLGICTQEEPDLIEISRGHKVRCWLYQDGKDHQAPLRTTQEISQVKDRG